MKKTLLLTLILLVSAAWAVAQTSQSTSPSSPSSTQSYLSGSSSGQMGSQSSQPSSQSSSGMSNTAKETHIQGCLSDSAGNYTLTDSSGTTWKLEGDSSDLSKHVGQEVRISGSSSSAGMGSSATGSSASSGAGAAEQTLNVTKVKKVANTCSTSGSANPSAKHSKY